MGQEHEGLDDLLKKAEIEKIRAETTKAEAEREQINQNLKASWFRSRVFLQAIAAGLVAVPLIWFYIKEIAIPLYNRENLKLGIEIQEEKQKLATARQKHQSEVENLEASKSELRGRYLEQLKELTQQKERIDARLLQLTDEFEKLSNQLQLTQQQRDDYATEHTELKAELQEERLVTATLKARLSKAEEKYTEATMGTKRTMSLAPKLTESSAIDISPYKNDYALLIGIDEYQDRHIIGLQYAVADATAMRELLVSDYGFKPQNVHTLYNKEATRIAILSAFYGLIASVSSSDRLIVFWSGHGTQNYTVTDRAEYLIPFDATSDIVYHTSVSVETLIETLMATEARHTLFLSDASYAGGSAKSASPSIGKLGVDYLYPFQQERSIEIIAAAGEGGPVIESAEFGHGVFTYAVLKGLGTFAADANNDGIITTLELVSFLRLELSEFKMAPSYMKLGGQGTMFFAKPERQGK